MVDYKLMGFVPNPDINDYYRSERVDCFITTSCSEGGAPVSVAEAISNGIPVIATDAGGLPEMVKDNGILLPGNPSEEQVAEAIIHMVTLDESSVDSMRRSSRKLWRERFDAVENAKRFTEYLKTLCNSESDSPNNNLRIVLITDGYPYGGEQSFIEPELREILKSFDVDLISLTDDKHYRSNQELAESYINRVKSNQPDTLHSLRIIRSDSTWHLTKCLRFFFKYYTDGSVSIERTKIIQSGEKIPLRLWESMKCYARAILFFKDTLEEVLRDSDPANTIIYTYWHRYPTLAACLNKHRYGGIRIITREHGYDLYDDRTGRSNRQPFREVMDPLLDGIVFACRKGLDYYLQRNHIEDPSDKYRIFYLGSTATDVQNDKDIKATTSDNDIYRIVSCSRMDRLKRIDLIIKGLKLANDKLVDRGINKCIEWIHFGDGNLMEEVTSLAAKQLGGQKRKC